MSAHLPGNPHHASAEAILKLSDEAPLIHAELAATQALTEATLALAHEQRTTNLIAYRALSTGYNCRPMDNERKTELDTTIHERLNLKQVV